MIKNKTIKNLLSDQSKELTNILNVFLLQKNKNFNKLCLSSIKAIKNKKKNNIFWKRRKRIRLSTPRN
jgi:hypothetical protein